MWCSPDGRPPAARDEDLWSTIVRTVIGGLRGRRAAILHEETALTQGTGVSVASHVDGHVLVVPAETRCSQLDVVFRGHPSLPCVAVRNDHGLVGLVMRTRFYQAMSGPFGFGRALWGHHPVSRLADWSALVLPPRTSIVEASHRLRQRPPAGRYDDLLVDLGAGRLGRISAAGLFDALASRLAEQAVRDDLTGLANRTAFLERLATACADATDGGPSVAVAFVDLDGMKRVNDARGHNAGDALLIAVARRLTTAVAADGLVARLGGDEFAVLCRGGPPGAGHPDGRALGEALRRAVDCPEVSPPTGIPIRASVGVALSAGRVDAQTWPCTRPSRPAATR